MFYRHARLAALLLPLTFAMPGYAQDAKPADVPENPVVATVNGSEIRLSDVEDARSLLPNEYRQFPTQTVFEPLVMALIDIKLAAKAARDQGLADDDDVKRMLERTHEQVLQQALIRKEIKEKMTDEFLKSRYDEIVAESPGETLVKARHILLKTKEDAEAVIKELQGGADFSTLAKERSTGPSGPDGGDLGYFERDKMLPPFAEAAFAMEIGSYSETPVETDHGWHVILVEDKRESSVPAFEDIKDQLRERLSGEVVGKMVEGLRADADIKRFKPDGSPM